MWSPSRRSWRNRHGGSAPDAEGRSLYGRFTAKDPIQPGTAESYTSAYAYAGDRPTYAVDPSGQSWWDPITSRLEAIGSGLKEGAELPFTFVGDLADAVSGRNGGAGAFLDKYVPIRPAYRLYRAADMLRQQGCDQLADQYDAAADQLTQQILLTGIGGLTGWERAVVFPEEADIAVGNLRFGPRPLPS